MVKATGAKARAGASRPLNQPRPVKVVEGPKGWPIEVCLRNTPNGVASVEDRWRIDDEWWRERPVSRMYFDCVLQDGRRLTLFQDLVTGRWYRQVG